MPGLSNPLTIMGNEMMLENLLTSEACSGASCRYRECLSRCGLPNSKTDGWRFTDLSLLYGTSWHLIDTTLPADTSCFADDKGVVNIVNGRCVRSWEDENYSVSVCSKSDVPFMPQLESHPFGLLGMAAANEVTVIRVKAHASISRLSVNLLTKASGGLGNCAAPCLHIIVEDGASAIVKLSYVSDDDARVLCLSNAHVWLGKGASLNMVEVLQPGLPARHVGNTIATLKSDSTFRHGLVNLGSVLNRHDVTVDLCEEGSSAELNGVYLSNSDCLTDHQTRINHYVPGCSSNQMYKGVLSGNGRAVFNGLINVAPCAQKTSALQSNKNILLSRDAKVDATPQLEIYADDVKCSHGCTVGRLDENQLFFLRARGIPEKEARAVLIYAFINEVVQKMGMPEVEALVLDAVACLVKSVSEVEA